MTGDLNVSATSVRVKQNAPHVCEVRFVLLNGASDEARTRYLHLGKVALYQMSYTRSDKWYYSRKQSDVNPKI